MLACGDQALTGRLSPEKQQYCGVRLGAAGTRGIECVDQVPLALQSTRASARSSRRRGTLKRGHARQTCAHLVFGPDPLGAQVVGQIGLVEIKFVNRMNRAKVKRFRARARTVGLGRERGRRLVAGEKNGENGNGDSVLPGAARAC